MPTRHGAPLGAPCWIDLTTSDVDRAQDFYGTVFGWTFESAGPEFGGYVNAAKDGQPVAGLMANSGLIVVVSLISPFRQDRAAAREAAREVLDRAHGKPTSRTQKAKAKMPKAPAEGGMTVIVKRFTDITPEEQAAADETERLEW